MATTKRFNQFPPTSTLLSSDKIPIDQGGIEKYITAESLLEQINDGSPFRRNVLEVSGTSRTLSAGDIFGYIRCLSASTTVITIPSSSSVPWSIGDTVKVYNTAGAVEFVGSGVFLNFPAIGNTMSIIGEEATLTYLGSNSWDISYTGVTIGSNVVSVTSYAALLALTPADWAVGKAVTVTDDGVAGQFRVVAGSATDNGGTIITNGTWNAASKHWQRLYSDPVNVRWFGAKGDGVTDDIDSIQASVDFSRDVVVPAGVFGITRAIHLKYPKQKFRGAGMGATDIKPLAGFSSSTIGGLTRSAAVWYQPEAGFWYDITGWVIGGEISDFTLNLSGSGIQGIVTNRVSQNNLISRVHIFYPTVGIENTWFGWCNTYDSVYVQNASIVSVGLYNGANGCTFSGCFLWGTDVGTPVHLDINGDKYHGVQGLQTCAGNAFTGGAIEGGLIGIRATCGQIAVAGTDFEDISQAFAYTTGFYNPTLQLAGPPTTFTGCQFVGRPGGGVGGSNYGFISKGATFNFDSCNFFNTIAPPTLSEFSGSISGSILTLPSPATGTMEAAQAINGVGIPPGVRLVSLGTAPTWGAAGTYNISVSLGVIGLEPMEAGSSYLFYCEATAQQVGTLPAPSISESNSSIIGWGSNLYVGFSSQNSTALGATCPSSRFLGNVQCEGLVVETGYGIKFRSGTTGYELTDFLDTTYTPGMTGTGWGSGMTASGKVVKMGRLVTFIVNLSGATNSSVRTNSTLTLPTSITSSGVATITDSYNTSYGSTTISSGGVVYMPDIPSTAADIIISGSYFST